MAKKEKKQLLDLKDVQDRLTGVAKDVWLAGLGALSTAKDEGNKVYASLISKGSELEAQGKKSIEAIYNDVKNNVRNVEAKVTTSIKEVEHKVSTTVEDSVKDVMHRLDIPSRDEISNLISKVEKLTKKVDELSKATAKPSADKPAPVRKTAPKKAAKPAPAPVTPVEANA